jgi:very-short-patch-repair endonuclease/KaiC/GvpD/RAD55 family RecA-like ATPase
VPHWCFSPVELARKSARTGFNIQIAEDDPIVNPALVEYLKRDHGVSLPDLPDPSTIAEDYDLQIFFQGVTSAIQGKKGWAVKTDMYLTQFTFQKFVMYKDLEANTETLKAHRIVRQIVLRDSNTPAQVMGLPDDIRMMNLDEDFPPECTSQVVDADSSQLRAIAATSRGHDLVIEGPPGTGKSQTITNLIAQALADGKSVLFVAEKMAALSVVFDRLVKAGLAEFCLQLHSTKANKRAVMKELASALDSSLRRVTTDTTTIERLPEVRTTLTEYVNALHTPFGSMNLTPYWVFGELGATTQAPRLKYQGSVDGDVTQEMVARAIRALRDLCITAQPVGNPAEHPWRDSHRTFYSEDDLDSVRDLAVALVTQFDDLIASVAQIQQSFDLPPITTFAEVETSFAIAEVMARSPGAALTILESDVWNKPPPETTDLIERGLRLNQMKDRIAQLFNLDVLEQDHARDIAYVDMKSEGFLSFLAILDTRYRSIRKRWRGYRVPGYLPSLAEQANDMRHVDSFRDQRKALKLADPSGRELFGVLWEGEKSDWEILRSYVHWVVEFRKMCVAHNLSRKAIQVATQGKPDISPVQALRIAATQIQEGLGRLGRQVEWPGRYLSGSTISHIRERVASLRDGVELVHGWTAFEATRQAATCTLAGECLPFAMEGRIFFPDLIPAFQRAFYVKWLSLVMQSRPVLMRFQTLTHEERVREFRELDMRVLRDNRTSLIGRLRDRLQTSLQSPAVSEQMRFLSRELVKQRRLTPLRRTMQQSGIATRAIKPCFMMSPLTVAQLLDASLPPFDLVIFDEASQLPPEDAVGAVMRGKQLVVVGDPKQLPPTNFFSVANAVEPIPSGDDGQPLFEDSESILEECMGVGVPMSRLKWHYRSAHESLITFSNTQFYDADLNTFPSVETGTDTYGLQFEYLPFGVYQGKGLNIVEARRVADEVVRFAKEQLHHACHDPSQMQSLGVGTFNMRQQLAILDALEQRRRDDPSIEPFFDRGAAEPFFVKNLENIQGDERDVIFISVTYAKASDGKLRYNFGPLNGENGWRRLNVLTTRARQRMRVFSSMRGDEISVEATSSRGARLLREFLTYAEHGKIESVQLSAAGLTESPFERDVLGELMNRGLKVQPQVGVAGYRIDLGVLDHGLPGRFLCGIECDGVAYHSSETARDRDRLRQQVLEARGWVIHRVWSTDWFKDRKGQIDRLLRLIEMTKTQSVNQRRVEATTGSIAQGDRLPDESIPDTSRQSPSLSATAPVMPATAVPYRVTPGEMQFADRDILTDPLSQLTRAVEKVVVTESPIHEIDLFSRVASFWGKKAGSRIQARIREAANSALRRQKIQLRGEFYWHADGRCEVRSRGDVLMPAKRIAPEEYECGILAILSTGRGFTRTQLTVEVRSLLGFSRTGSNLDASIGAVIDGLLAQGKVGESSTGIRLRE